MRQAVIGFATSNILQIFRELNTPKQILKESTRQPPKRAFLFCYILLHILIVELFAGEV